MGEQEHLHHGAAREHLHHRAGARFDLCDRFAHLHAGDSLDLLSQRFAGIGEQLPVKVLHLRGACRAVGQGLLSGRQGPVQRDHQGVLAEDHGHRFRRVARPLLLESTRRLGNLLGHG